MDKKKRMIVVPITATLKGVLDALDRGAHGVVFLENKQGRILGLFTDGDVRRALLAGAGIDDPAADYMNPRFVSAPAGKQREWYIAQLTEKIRHLPILDEQGQLVDFLSWVELWKKPVMEPNLSGNELKYVTDCINTNWISSQGEYVRRFEQGFAGYHDMPFGCGVMNCTCALHLALVALGVSPGDEVIVPDLTFAASANAVLHAGASPVLVDVDPVTWTMDTTALEQAVTPRTKAVMPVHLYGHPCDMDPILAIAERHGLFVVEDCAEALGARYKGRLTGTFGHAACFSFFSNKVLTTGEGGMILTRDEKLDQRLRILRDHGMRPGKRYWHDSVGYNYRMTNMQAAIGLAQLERLEGFLDRRQCIRKRYDQKLRHVHDLILLPQEPWAAPVMWLYTLQLPDNSGLNRDEVMKRLARSGIDTRPVFYPLHYQPPYLLDANTFPATEMISRRGLSLPSSIELEEQDIDYICRQIIAILDDLLPV